MSYWGVLWRAKNKIDGKTSHLIYQNCLPLLFVTRREAQTYIKANYAYIADRKDLRSEPHGWRMPIPVKVTVRIEGK